jgi:hypothetical protein
MTSDPNGTSKQCSALVVNCTGRTTAHSQSLQLRGFRVTEIQAWPADEVALEHEIVILVLRRMDSVAVTAARMRAKPRFGNRVLIGVTESAPSAAERRHAILVGYDDLVGESGDSRVLIARVLRILRTRPEHRCLVPDKGSSAA